MVRFQSESGVAISCGEVFFFFVRIYSNIFPTIITIEHGPFGSICVKYVVKCSTLFQSWEAADR